MDIGIPKLKYFQGGFILSGNYKKIKVNHKSCGQVSKGMKNLMSSLLKPDEFKRKILIMDTVIDKVVEENPALKEFTIKPSELIEVFNELGVSGVTEIITEKKDKLVATGDVMGTLKELFSPRKTASMFAEGLKPEIDKMKAKEDKLKKEKEEFKRLNALDEERRKAKE